MKKLTTIEWLVVAGIILTIGLVIYCRMHGINPYDWPGMQFPFK